MKEKKEIATDWKPIILAIVSLSGSIYHRPVGKWQEIDVRAARGNRDRLQIREAQRLTVLDATAHRYKMS